MRLHLRLFAAALLFVGLTAQTSTLNVKVNVLPAVKFAPTSVSFPAGSVGVKSGPANLVATNGGASAVAIGSISFVGANAGDFSETDNCGSTIAAGGSCTISVYWTPSGTTQEAASLSLNGMPPAHSYLAALTGGGASLVSGFYLATNGSDSNAGTLAAPFATFAKAQSAMRGSSIKTTYVRGGTYALTSSIGSCGGQSSAIILGTADAGETLSYYPPDGPDSAVISGAGSTVNVGVCMLAVNLTINGLQIQNYYQNGISSLIGSNAHFLIENNLIHDIGPGNNSNGCVSVGYSSQQSTITHNAVYNCDNMGIEVSTFGVAHDADGMTMSNNYSRNNGYAGGANSTCDCGAFYYQDPNGGSTGITISNNYGQDTHGKLLYLDDGATGVTVSGNVMLVGNNKGYACAFIHGGKNDVFTGNICDMSAAAGGGPGTWILIQQGSSSGSDGNTGNSWEHNIVLCAAANNCGGGYFGQGPLPAAFAVVTNNGYQNYSGSGVNSGVSGGGTGDSAPVSVNPGFTCGWEYSLPGGAAVYSSIAFPTQPSNWGQSGFWGPPGFSIPQTGTAPSPPHTC